VAASAQSQALNAIVFLYDGVFGKPLGAMTELKGIQRRERVPVVLTQDEVRAVLMLMSGPCRLMAELLYGAGLCVHECVTLRVKDMDLAPGRLRFAKARAQRIGRRCCRKDWCPLWRIAALHRDDLARRGGFAPMPDALARKYPSDPGSKSFRRRACVRGATAGAGTRRTPQCSGRSSTRFEAPVFSRMRVFIACGIAWRPTYWPPARIFGRSSCYLAIAA
jgi:integrase